MDIKGINSTLAITEFLARQGVMPDRPPRGRYVKYISPIREREHTASFSVDVIKNTWKDFGTGQGGNLFDLARELHPSKSNRDLLQELNRMAGQGSYMLSPEAKDLQARITEVKQDPGATESTIQVTGYSKITEPALWSYIKERRIAEGVAQRYFKQVYYQYKNKSFYALGFENDEGGFALRNKHIKLASKPNGSTFIDNGRDTLIVTEGAFSFASVETVRQYMRLPESNYLILNSLSFLKGNRMLMENHHKVFSCLDNDERGNSATALLKAWNPGKFWDARRLFAGEKDPNKWLINNLDKVMLQHTKMSIQQKMKNHMYPENSKTKGITKEAGHQL